MLRKKSLHLLIALIVFCGTTAFHTCALGELTPEQKKLNQESFEYVWKTIHNLHFDTTFGGLDWKAVHDELLPKMDSAADMDAAREVLQDMISRLKLSHFGIIPAEAYQNITGPAQKGDAGGHTGIDVRVVDGKALVVTVREGTAGAEAGIKPGWEIVKIGDEEIPPILESIAKEFDKSNKQELYLVRAVRSRLSGAIGDSVTVAFVDDNDQGVQKTIELRERAGKKAIFGNLPAFYLTIDVDTLAGGIGYFAFSGFIDPVTLMGAFNQAMMSFMTAPGIIIDIRGNPGGLGGIAVGMAGWLVDQKNLYLGTLTTRDTELKLIVNPRAQTYAGPVAILVDGLSVSSSEFLAGGLQDIGRARIFGTQTLGAALPSAIEKLPNGDGFQYVFANYVSGSGRALEGEGVIPDQMVQHTREALREGRDRILDAAVEWIMSNRRSQE